MASVNVYFVGDASQLQEAADKAANAVRATTERIQEKFAAVSNGAADYTERVAQTAANANERLSALAGGLDRASTATALAAAGFDAMRLPMVSDRLATLSGRIEEVNGFVKIAAEGTQLAADHFGTASMVAADYTNRLQATTTAAEDAARAQAQLADATQEAETNWGAWIAVAAITATVVGGIYLVTSAMEKVAETAADAARATAAYAAEISGATALQQRFTAEAMASAAALAELAREMGIGAEHLAALSAVAHDYQVTESQAEAAMRRMVEVIEDQSDKTKEAREVLAAYGVSLKDLSAQDWAVLLDRFAVALDGVKDSTQKTRDAIAVLGSEGARWLKGIAEGAGEVSHAATEVDRIHAVVAARIAESQKKIAAGPGVAWYDFWSQPLQRLDQMVSRTDEFKAKQEYALSHIAIAWEEYQADVASLGNVWDGLTKSAEDYFALVTGKLQVPALADNRSGSPVPNARAVAEVASRKPVEDESLKAFEEDLEAKKRLKENWLGWNRQREIEYWQEVKRQWLEAQDMMTDEQLARSKVLQGMNAKIADLGRADAQENAKSANEGQVERWRNQLETMKAEQGRWFNWSKAEEIAYWQERLSQVKAGTREYTQIEKELLNLKREDAREGFEVELSYMRAAQEAEKGSAAAQLAIAKTIADRIADTYGERSQRHHQALLDMERAERAHAEQITRINEIARQSRTEAANDNFEDARNELNFRREMGRITAVEEIQQLKALERQRHQIEQQTRREKLADIKNDVVAQKQALKDIEQAERQHANKMAQLDRQQAVARRNAIREWTSPIKEASNEMVNGILHGTLAADQIASTFLTGLVGKYVAHLGEIAMEWIETHVLMGLWAWITGEEEIAAATTSAATGALAAKTAAASEAAGWAAAGAAAAMASVAAIPFVGWAMAPAVGAEHYALAMTYAAAAAVPAAEKGWWEVPNDTLAVIHKKEMVMPAPLAEGVRRMVEGGGSASDSGGAQPITFAPTVIGMDRQAVQTMLRREAVFLADLVQGQNRKFQKRRS